MSRAARTALIVLSTLAAPLLASCSDGDGGGDDAPGSTSYGTETLMPAVVEAVSAEEYVHLGLGDQRGRPDIQIDMTWAGSPEFRALTGTEPGQILEVVRVNGRVYVGGEATGNEWTYLPEDDPRVSGDDEDFDAGVVPVLVAIDVPGEYESLVDAVTKVENAGEEEMNGVPATHYTVTVDSEVWHGALPEDSVHRQMEVDDPLVMDLWVDEASLPVRLEYAGAGGRSDTARIDYSNWGTPIAVVEPEDAEQAGGEGA